MKVTAIIPDELINKVKKETGGKNITESITIALKAYLAQQKIGHVIEEIEKEPLEFQEEFVPYGPRKINRNR